MIPVEAVEAAAKAYYELGFGSWEGAHADTRAVQMEDMLAALEAAAPHMRVQALEDAVHAFPLETIIAPDNAVVWMMRRAEDLWSKK